MMFNLNMMGIKVKFVVANSSINVTQGTISVFTAFQIYPSTVINPDSSIEAELIDFPNILYDDVADIIIERTLLSENSLPNYEQLASFPCLTNSTKLLSTFSLQFHDKGKVVKMGY